LFSDTCKGGTLPEFAAYLLILGFHVTIESIWVTMPLSKLFREKGRERVGVPSSSERAPERAATVPTVPRVSRDGASLTRATGNRTTGRTTLAVIAAEAGVSLPTVSKVVNGRPDVAADTRARVERLLDEYQYTRVGTGRQRRSGLIDLVFSGLDSPWAVEILRGVEEWGASHETGVAVSAVRHGNARPASWTSALASHDTEGVIVVISETTEDQLQ
jgi:hypothetical protein